MWLVDNPVLQEAGGEVTNGSLDDEIVEIWENKMQPHLTESQVRLNQHHLPRTHMATEEITDPRCRQVGSPCLLLPTRASSGSPTIFNLCALCRATVPASGRPDPDDALQVPTHELLGYINKRVMMEGELVKFLRSLFQGLPPHTEQGKELRSAVLHRVIWLIIKGQLTGKKAEEAVNVLLTEVSYNTLRENQPSIELLTLPQCLPDGCHTRRRIHRRCGDHLVGNGKRFGDALHPRATCLTRLRGSPIGRGLLFDFVAKDTCGDRKTTCCWG